MANEETNFDDTEQDFIDINSSEEEPPIIQYDITSYGADYTVDGLVKKMNRGDIFIPNLFFLSCIPKGILANLYTAQT